MIYTEQTQKAMTLCYKAHHNQVDKGGVPYVFHPIHVAEQMDDEISTIVALLHDVVEDTEYTFKDLEEMGFAGEVIETLKLLTHDKNVEYLDYVRNLAKNPTARKVKLADLAHNLDGTRMKISEKHMARRMRYFAAREILMAYQDETAMPDVPLTEEDQAMLNKQERRKYRDQIRGSLIGGAAGDALGYAVEFIDSDRIFAQFGNNGITEYELHRGLAQISDDTQMTLFTAAGLLHAATKDKGEPQYRDSIYRSYLDWLETQYQYGNHTFITWLGNEKALYQWQAPGNTCLSALNSGRMGTVEKSINHSKGCGGVMRVAPIGLYQQPNGADSELQIMMLAADAAAITHGHPLGYIPAAALAYIVNRVVYRWNPGDCPSQIIRECKEKLVQLFGENAYTSRMNALIDLAAKLAAEPGLDVDHIESIGGGWVGEEALAIALYCWLRYPADFDRALIASVNHSGDSDSTGAILGNIMGAVFGYNAISEKWKQNLELHDVILEVADDLCDDCHDFDRMKKYVCQDSV